jgi:hypothetical protein
VGPRLLAGAEPALGRGSYVNFMMEEGQDRIEATYGANFERLQAGKAKYDPDNFCHVNQNVRPSMPMEAVPAD